MDDTFDWRMTRLRKKPTLRWKRFCSKSSMVSGHGHWMGVVTSAVGEHDHQWSGVNVANNDGGCP